MKYIIKVEVVNDDYNDKKIWAYKSLKSKEDLYNLLEANSDNNDKHSFMMMLKYFIENI